jgi:prepilin-type N-terminal cleavage/methylation domain-containing protein
MMKTNRKSQGHQDLLRWSKISNRGFSLVEVMVGLAMLGIMALATSKMLSDGYKASFKATEKSEVQSIRALVGKELDCEQTIAMAKQQYGVSRIQDVCSSGNFLDGLPIRLYGKGGIPLTGALNADRYSSGRIIGSRADRTDLTAGGGERVSKGLSWWVRSICNWPAQTLEIRAVSFRDDGAFARDPIRTTLNLDFNQPRLTLFGPKLPICRFSQQVRLSKVENMVLDSRFSLTIGVDEKDVGIEISTEGQYQGSWDSGADTYFSHVVVDLVNQRYKGSQIVKIGSDRQKSRAVVWQDTIFNESPKSFTGAPSYYLSWPYSGDYAEYGNKKMPIPLVKGSSGASGRVENIEFREYLANSNSKAVDPKNEYFWRSAVIVRHFATP